MVWKDMLIILSILYPVLCFLNGGIGELILLPPMFLVFVISLYFIEKYKGG